MLWLTAALKRKIRETAMRNEFMTVELPRRWEKESNFTTVWDAKPKKEEQIRFPCFWWGIKYGKERGKLSRA